jgi:adenylate cyclase
MGDANRRLAGILAADVVGYSTMVGTDEPATLARVRSLRTEIIEPVAASHGGRLFKTTGDGFLAAFASAVQALRCAIAIQERLNSEPDGLRVRIGVHQGEVVAEGDDLLGDGVIIAARLEPLAEPGGICISARVREDAAGKMALEVDDLGTPELKNIAAKIQVFRVRLGIVERPALPLPDKPSIAVLAFTNMSGDPEQEYFSDGIANDIITELSRIRWLFVTARNSSFTYRGGSVDVKQVSRELGVRYVVEGSVRRAAERVRISAQLIDAETGNHVWAERYDRRVVDVFDVQDDITAAVSRAIAPAISHAERQRAIRKPPENLDAWEAYQRAMWHQAKSGAANVEQARHFLERAIELDPLFAAAHAMLAISRIIALTIAPPLSLRDTVTMDTVAMAEAAARKAIELDPDEPSALTALARVAEFKGDRKAALELTEQAILVDPNYAGAHIIKGGNLIYSGRTREGREVEMAALRLNPRDPMGLGMRLMVAISYYYERDYQNAAGTVRSAIRDYPDHPNPYRWLAASLGQLGLGEEARAALQQAIKVSAAAFNFYVSSCPPWIRPEDHEHMLDGLRKAGWQG